MSDPGAAPGADRSRRWYGRRHGRRLRPGRRGLLETLLPRLRIVLPPHGERLEAASLGAGAGRDLWLEVGFGAGEHLAAQARAHPDIAFIGCEPFVNGVAGLLAHIERDGLANVRIFDDDARRLLDALPDACLGRVFVLFPDPWPKKRHRHRRFIGPATLDGLARVMADGAELRVASDSMTYIVWTLDHVTRHRDFRWTARTRSDWTQRPADGFPTRYERKARTQGAACVYLRFVRRPRG